MYCNKCGALLSDSNNYCQQCGNYISNKDGQQFCVKSENTNGFVSNIPIYNSLKKLRTVSLLSVFSPLISNFFILSVILFIFIKGKIEK